MNQESPCLQAGERHQHHVSTDWFRRRGGWAWWCSCLTDGEGVYPDGDGARRSGARHQAERVAEALAHGAPQVAAAAGLVGAWDAGSPQGGDGK